MGGVVQKIREKIQPSHKRYILAVGMHRSGKTTVVFGPKLKSGWEQHEMLPTNGYNYEEIRIQQQTIGIFDTPGSPLLEQIVQTLYKNIRFSGILFVVDVSMKPDHYTKAKRRLKYLCAEPTLSDCSIAVVVNLTKEVEGQFRSEEFLERILGLNEIPIPGKNKKLFVYDAKYQHISSSDVMDWLGRQVLRKEVT